MPINSGNSTPPAPKTVNQQTNNSTKHSFNFNKAEHPELPKKNKKQPTKLQQQITPSNQPNPSASQSPINVKALREQIMADMQNDLTKMISKEITTIHTKLKDQITNLSNSLKKDMNTQIADILQTIAALNQRFNKVMDRLPPNPNSTPAHKKPKGLGIIN